MIAGALCAVPVTGSDADLIAAYVVRRQTIVVHREVAACGIPLNAMLPARTGGEHFSFHQQGLR